MRDADTLRAMAEVRDYEGQFFVLFFSLTFFAFTCLEAKVLILPLDVHASYVRGLFSKHAFKIRVFRS